MIKLRYADSKCMVGKSPVDKHEFVLRINVRQVGLEKACPLDICYWHTIQ